MIAIFMADFGQFEQDKFDKGGFVASGVVFFRDRCQIGGVGFHEDSFCRYLREYFTQIGTSLF